MYALAFFLNLESCRMFCYCSCKVNPCDWWEVRLFVPIPSPYVNILRLNVYLPLSLRAFISPLGMLHGEEWTLPGTSDFISFKCIWLKFLTVVSS